MKKLLKTEVKKETFNYIMNKKIDDGLRTLGESLDLIIKKLKGGTKK